MLWSILLGCDDFHSKEEIDSGQRHRRPAAADMTDVADRLGLVAKQLEVRWQGVACKNGWLAT